MLNAGLFTFLSGNWETPQGLFDELDREFGFTIDVCASNENAKCSVFYTKEDDALTQQWRGVCWMNPPYGRKIGKWLKKALRSALEGATVVCLIPSRTDTRWWHDYVMQGEIRFIKGRLRFSNHSNAAPFPSAIVIFSPLPMVLPPTEQGQAPSAGPKRKRLPAVLAGQEPML